MNDVDVKLIEEYEKAREAEKTVKNSGGTILDSRADEILYSYHEGVSDEFYKWQEEERKKQ